MSKIFHAASVLLTRSGMVKPVKYQTVLFLTPRASVRLVKLDSNLSNKGLVKDFIVSTRTLSLNVFPVKMVFNLKEMLVFPKIVYFMKKELQIVLNVKKNLK